MRSNLKATQWTFSLALSSDLLVRPFLLRFPILLTPFYQCPSLQPQYLQVETEKIVGPRGFVSSFFPFSPPSLYSYSLDQGDIIPSSCVVLRLLFSLVSLRFGKSFVPSSVFSFLRSLFSVASNVPFTHGDCIDNDETKRSYATTYPYESEAVGSEEAKKRWKKITSNEGFGVVQNRLCRLSYKCSCNTLQPKEKKSRRCFRLFQTRAKLERSRGAALPSSHNHVVSLDRQLWIYKVHGTLREQYLSDWSPTRTTTSLTG